MIIEAIFGLAMNVFLADSAIGQNVTRSVLMYKKLERIESSKEEQKQFTKDLILGVNNDN